MARRSWNLGADAPFALTLSADGRNNPLAYADDQTWDLSLGSSGAPALALSTRYGGRAGLVSLQPMWWIDGHAIYEPGHYAIAPHVTAFAPAYLQIEAKLAPDLALIAAYYALDTHTVGVCFAIRNKGAPRRITLDLIAFAAAGGVERRIAPLGSSKANGTAPALSLGTFGDIDPVLMLAGGAHGDSPHKLTAFQMVAANGTAEWRTVIASLPDQALSRARAAAALGESWSKPPTTAGRAAASPPIIETGDHDLDTLLAFSVRTAMSAVVRTIGSRLPHATIIARRAPDTGYRPYARSDGSSGVGVKGEPGARPVNGDELTPTHAYTLALAIAPIMPEAAHGVIRNFLSAQRPDGWIDWSPGVNGERRGWLCLPILARLTWSVYQYSEDVSFLRTVYAGLTRFFDRWFQPDLDRDGDGFPEWQHEGQSAYPFLPIFSRGLTVGQNADLRYVESPDLPAYLLSEAISLREIAAAIGEATPPTLTARIDQLRTMLASLWRADLGRFAHRDRDVHTGAPSRVVVSDRPANETIGTTPIDPPARLIIEIVGGTTRPSTLTLRLDGTAHDGKHVSETADANDFSWTAGRGVYTTQYAYRQIETLRVQGVIAQYKVNMRTVDTTHLDITALLPAWAVAIDPAYSAPTLALLKDPAHFWRRHGVIMLSAQDSYYRPDQYEFAAAAWGFWNTLMGEALIEAGDFAGAADLLRRMLNGMIPVVKREKSFFEGYHADKLDGIGARGHSSGIAPLHLFLRVIGIRIVSANRVWTGGIYAWDHPVTIIHYGVTVRRSAEGTTVIFADGETVTLAPDAPWTRITPSGGA
ncbi:MAG: hypothetical protein SGJ24_07955 [Chloroflexota bacterium]|nr:hypothetical protein [Chloroflexota bacterium]